MTKSPKNLNSSDKWIKMVNFTLGNVSLTYFAMLLLNCNRWIDEHGTSVGQKKIESPTGIELMVYRTPDGRSIHWASRIHGEQGHFTEFICEAPSALSKSSWVVISKKRWILCSVTKCGRGFLSGTQIFSLSYARVMLINTLFTIYQKYCIKYQAIWELVTLWVRNIPVEEGEGRWRMQMNIWKIIYLNCGDRYEHLLKLCV